MVYFHEKDVVTRLLFDVDADSLVDALDRSSRVAETVEFPALRVELNDPDNPEHGPRYASRAYSAVAPDPRHTPQETLLAPAYPVLETYDFAADRYHMDDEDGVQSALLFIEHRFLPSSGVTIISMSGGFGPRAVEEFHAADLPRCVPRPEEAGRVHTAFEHSGDDPEQAMVRLHLWLPAGDLSTAIGLVREPVRRHDAAFVELLPAGKLPEDGYHAALLYPAPEVANDDRPHTLRTVATAAARTLGLHAEEVNVEQCGDEPIAFVARPLVDSHLAEPRAVVGVHVRLGGDPLALAAEDEQDEEDDEEDEPDVEPDPDSWAEEERAEFHQALRDLFEWNRVWLVADAEVRCTDGAIAEDVLWRCADEDLSRVSDEDVQGHPEGTRALDNGNHSARLSIRTFEDDPDRVLENLLTVLPTGTWHSETRPWRTERNKEVVLRWSPRRDEHTALIAELRVRVCRGVPSHLL
ncbi:hypothetical protein GCM10027444_05930 [Actinopolyspora lacussalsi]